MNEPVREEYFEQDPKGYWLLRVRNDPAYADGEVLAKLCVVACGGGVSIDVHEPDDGVKRKYEFIAFGAPVTSSRPGQHELGPEHATARANGHKRFGCVFISRPTEDDS